MRSGIADYSADLLPFLGEHCDLRLVHLPEQPISGEINRRYRVVAAELAGIGDRLPIYQMGNNPYHSAVAELARDRPGVLVLHDLVLHHLLVEGTLKEGDFNAYHESLTAEHGWLGEAAARPRRWPGGWADAAQFALPANRRLVASQRGVVVHNEWAAEQLREDVPGLEVRVVSMGVPLGPLANARAGQELRQKYEIPADVPLLGSFGFQTPIKRTETAIRALASPGLQDVHLLVAGQVAAACDYLGTARAAGVEGRVHLLGFLPFNELEAAIAATDLCLNLRYPTAGETSASLLRILAIGKAAIVSDHAQATELPDSCVVKVPLGDGEVEALVRSLTELLQDPGTLAKMGEAARHHIATVHDPEASAQAMVEAWRDLAEVTPVGEVADPAWPTSLAWDRYEGDLEVDGTEDWRDGQRRRLKIRLRNRSAARWLAAERGAGGIAIEVCLSGQDNILAPPWLALPFDLDPGAEQTFEIVLRRPRGAARLRIEPHVFGDRGFSQMGGPTWDHEI